MELFDDFGQSREVTLVKTQLAQLREEEEQRGGLQGGTRKKEGRRMGKGEMERGRITGGTRKEEGEDGERGEVGRGEGER